MPCPEGFYSDRTDLVNASQCTPTEPGYYAPVGRHSKPLLALALALALLAPHS